MHVAIDVLVRGPMKRSAKCDTHCELYDSVNRQQREHTLWCLGTPGTCMFQCLYHWIVNAHVAFHHMCQYVATEKHTSTDTCNLLAWDRKKSNIHSLKSPWHMLCDCKCKPIAIVPVIRILSNVCVLLAAWSHACTPAEFKHIGKRRKGNNIVCLQSLRTNKNDVAAPIVCIYMELLYTIVLPIRTRV